MSSQNQLPNYILEQLFQPGGRRLPKRQLWQDNPQKNWGSGLAQYQSRFIDRRLPSAYNKPIVIEFKGHEYQFWRSYSSGTLYQCRACYISMASPSDRKTHHENFGCAERIVKACKIVNERGVCVDCGNKTKNRKWGVPLCGKKCIDNWMMVGGNTGIFDVALGSVPRIPR